MIAYRFRVLGLVTLAAFAVSAMGSAILPDRISLFFKSSAAIFSAYPPYPAKPSRLAHPLVFRLPAEGSEDAKPEPGSQFSLHRNNDGEVVCRAATAAERQPLDKAELERLDLRPINHLRPGDESVRTGQTPAVGNLTIVLRATQQLQQNQAATAAFIRAAQNWESIIMSPVTIYIDVDYGPTRFGQPWPGGVLGSTSTRSHSYPYQSVRTNMIAEADGEGNATKQAIFSALPATTVPTDLGGSGSTVV